MKIAVPRMGNLPLIIRDIAQRFGLEYIETPPFSERTVEIGAALAPEFACFPLKAVLGSFVQVLEAGADTLVMGGGHGPCRFGSYGEVQKRILEREGYSFKMLILDSPSASLRDFHEGLRFLLPRQQVRLPVLLRELWRVLCKVVVFDEVEKWALALRGLEVEPGTVDAALEDSRGIISRAFSTGEIKEARGEALSRFDVVPIDRERVHLEVGLVGEIFIVLEPYFNFDIERWLGRRARLLSGL